MIYTHIIIMLFFWLFVSILYIPKEHIVLKSYVHLSTFYLLYLYTYLVFLSMFVLFDATLTHSPHRIHGNFRLHLILSSVFALVNGTARIICVFTVLEPELCMNLVKSAFMMWPIFIKIAPPTSTRN